MKQNIATDVHIESTVFEDSNDPDSTPRSSSAPLRDIPYFLLGRLIGAPEVTIHILFPHLTPQRVDGKFVALTNEQLTRWLDQIFHPAIYRNIPAHYT